MNDTHSTRGTTQTRAPSPWGPAVGILTCAGHAAGILGGAVVACVAAALRGSGVGGGAVFWTVAALISAHTVFVLSWRAHCGAKIIEA